MAAQAQWPLLSNYWLKGMRDNDVKISLASTDFTWQQNRVGPSTAQHVQGKLKVQKGMKPKQKDSASLPRVKPQWICILLKSTSSEQLVHCRVITYDTTERGPNGRVFPFMQYQKQSAYQLSHYFLHSWNKMPLYHGRTCTAYLYRCIWSGITGR